MYVPLFHVYPKPAYCSCICHGWPAQSAVCFLTIFYFHSPLWLALPMDWALLDSGLCFSPAHPFSCYRFLPYPFIILVVKLFASILLSLFVPAVYSSPNGPVRPLVLLLQHWWASMSHLFSLEHLEPICFPWASSAFFLTLHSHGLLLNSLGFPNPITLSLILEVHGFAINPLLLTFPHHILPIVCFFSLSRLLQVHLPPQCLFVYLMDL